MTATVRTYPDSSATVIDTFRKTALRTVLMIDDQFPTFSDLAKAACNQQDDTCALATVDARFKERPRAVRLYEMFRKRQMPCDIENKIEDLEKGDEIERIRKTDLIILDYNLDGREGDNRKSIRIIQRLAETKHFNTVVLYTATPDLDQVWLDVAFSLRGGWEAPSNLLDGSALETWENLSDEGVEFPAASNDLFRSYLLSGMGTLGKEKEQLALAWEKLGAAKDDADLLIEAWIHAAVRERLADRSSECGGEPRPLAGRCKKDRPRWLQAGNCFIAIMGKTKPDGVTDNDEIIDYLDLALKDWRPNLLQLIISEIQNIFELEPLATDAMHLVNPEVQTGLFYYLLQQVGSADLTDDGGAFKPGIEAIIDRLVDSVRRKISSNEDLSRNAAQLLASEIKRHEWKLSKFNEKKRFNAAAKIAGVEPLPDETATIFKLNAFLSTEEFKRGHITTGTIVRIAEQGADGNHWVCLSPACDMEDRKPSASNAWIKNLYPVKAFVMVSLNHISEHQAAVKDANKKPIIFLENKDGTRAFQLLKGDDPDTPSNPSYEIIFPAEAGRVSIDGDSYPKFRAYRLAKPEDSKDFCKSALSEASFEVVGQIRGQYASRFLQVIGHHFSRIGVDFVSMS